MIWTKQKKLIENFLADSLKGRVKFHRTRYGPGDSFRQNRGWVTLDQKEILSCSTMKSIIKTHELTNNWYSNDIEVIGQLHSQGIFDLRDFSVAIDSILCLKIDHLLSSDQPLVRAFVLFDRRVGKRKLIDMQITDDEFDVVKNFFRIRCEAEGL